MENCFPSSGCGIVDFVMEEIKVSDATAQAPSLGSQNPILKRITETREKLGLTRERKTTLIFAGLVLAGVATGYGLYWRQTMGTVRLAGKNVELVKTPTEEGVKDAATFPDTATGILAENDGKITDEGTHILVRGDISQNVYLTSSVIDLSKYVGKKTQIWGETFRGLKAGWLMDVGRVKVVDG